MCTSRMLIRSLVHFYYVEATTMKLLIAGLVLFMASATAKAAVKTKDVTYTHDGVTLKGYLAWDDAIKGKRPGVLVVHEWWGINPHAKKQAEKLAEAGFVAFACDMYGEGKLAKDPKEAGELAGSIRKNAKLWEGRALAGLKILQDNEMVDAKKLASIGYCFGGSTSLQLAYAGAPLAAVVSFHGALTAPTDEQAKSIKARILICHGAADSFIQEKNCQDTRDALEKAKVDYAMVYYGGARHSFTVEAADKAGIDGIRYQPEADRRSWQHMLMHFREAFGDSK